MQARLWKFLLALVVVVASPAARAQQSREPRLGYIFPAGGRSGSEVAVTVGGQFLEGTKEVVLSGQGVQASVVGYRKPLPQKRFNEFRDYIQEEKKKRSEAKAAAVAAKTALPEPKRAPDSREAISQLLKETGATDEEIANFFLTRDERSDPKRQQNQQLADSVMLQMVIAPDAPPGPRSLRLVTPTGISNPVIFCVGALPESAAPVADKSRAPETLALPTVLNGRILPGETHTYFFDLRRGQQIVVAVQARDLIPYLADAVPGWFEPVVVFFNPKHQEVAASALFRTGPDPVFRFEVPESGNYRLEIRDSLYRGREDFVYRVTLGEIPFVSGIFPLGGRVGETSAVDVRGWNLRVGRPFPVVADRPGLQAVPALANGFVTGEVAFAGDDLPEVMAKESKNGRPDPQRVSLPVTINGRIDTPGDSDLFSFHCRAGEKVVAEILARRLHSPLDSWLRVTDSSGHQLAFNDDFEDKGAGLLTDQADARIAFTVPSEGLYFVEVGNTRKTGGVDFSYRLRLSAPRPDFALRVAPSTINGRAGAVLPVTLYAFRKDGFQGDIDVYLKEPSAGFFLEGGRIPAGADKVRATLALPPEPTALPVRLTMEGAATVGDKTFIRPAVPAEDMLQAFIYRHLVPAEEFFAMVTGNKNANGPVLVSGPLSLPVGGSGQVVVSRRGRAPFTIAETQLVLSDPPEGITLEGIKSVPGGASISFRCSDKAKPGTRGNLILEGFSEKSTPAKDGGKPTKSRWPIGLLPAITFEVTAP